MKDTNKRKRTSLKNMTPDEKLAHQRKQRRKHYEILLKKQGKTPNEQWVNNRNLTPDELIKHKKEQSHRYYLNKLKKEGRTPYVKRDKEIMKIEKKLTRQIKNKDKSNPQKVKFVSKNYIQDVELTYQLILSKGKGSPTMKLYEMLFLINNKVNNVFTYNYYEDKQDVVSETFIHLLENYMNFDHEKFKKSLPYITELIKRNAAKYFKEQIIRKGIRSINDDISYVYIDNDYNKKEK